MRSQLGSRAKLEIKPGLVDVEAIGRVVASQDRLQDLSLAFDALCRSRGCLSMEDIILQLPTALESGEPAVRESDPLVRRNANFAAIR